MPNRRPLAFIPGSPCAAFRDDDVATNVPEQARALPPDNFHQADVTAAQRILAGAPQDPRVAAMTTASRRVEADADQILRDNLHRAMQAITYIVTALDAHNIGRAIQMKSSLERIAYEFSARGETGYSEMIQNLLLELDNAVSADDQEAAMEAAAGYADDTLTDFNNRLNTIEGRRLQAAEPPVEHSRFITCQELLDAANRADQTAGRIASALSVGDRVVPILNDEVGEGSPEFYPGYGEIENVYEDYGEQVADVRWDTGDRDEGVPLATLRPWTRRDAARGNGETNRVHPTQGTRITGQAGIAVGDQFEIDGELTTVVKVTPFEWGNRVYFDNGESHPEENLLEGRSYIRRLTPPTASRRTAEPGGILPFFGDVPFSTAIIQNPAGTYSIVGSIPMELTEEVENPMSWPPPRRSKVFQTLEEAEAALQSVGVTEYQVPGGGWRGREGQRRTAIGSYLDSTGRQLKPGDWVQHAGGAHPGGGEIQSLGEGEELDWWGHIPTFGPGKVLVAWDDGEWTGEDPGSLTFSQEGAGQTIIMGTRTRRAVADMNGRSLSFGDGVVIASTGELGEVIGWDATAGLVQVRIEAGERHVAPTDLRRVGRGQASRTADAATPPFDPAIGDRVQIIAGPDRGQQGVVLNTGTDEYGAWAAVALDAAPQDPMLVRFSDLSKVMGARRSANALDGEMSLEVDGEPVTAEDLTGWGLYMKTEPTPMVQMDAPFKVDTMEGPMNADAGDFLAQGPEGELYPVDMDVQSKTYEPIQAGRHVAMKVRLDSDGVGFTLTNVATGEDAYFQTDWDFPGLAQSLGWHGEESDVSGASQWLSDNAGIVFDVLAVDDYFSVVASRRKGAIRLNGSSQVNRQLRCRCGHQTATRRQADWVNPGDEVSVVGHHGVIEKVRPVSDACPTCGQPRGQVDVYDVRLDDGTLLEGLESNQVRWANRTTASTGADCWFEERTPGEWYYHLQRYPYGATQDYDVEGPFRSYQEADRHLSANYANPGGETVSPYKGPLGPSTYNPTEGSRRTAFDTGFEPLAVGDRVEVPKGLMANDYSIEGFEEGVIDAASQGMVEIQLLNGQRFRTWEGHLRKVPAARRSLRGGHLTGGGDRQRGRMAGRTGSA